MYKILLMISILSFWGCVEEIPVDQLDQETFQEGTNSSSPKPTPVPPTSGINETQAPKFLSVIPKQSEYITGTKEVTITVTTDIKSHCRFHEVLQGYKAMTSMDQTDSLEHSQTITGLSDGDFKKIWIKCAQRADSTEGFVYTDSNFSIKKSAAVDPNVSLPSPVITSLTFAKGIYLIEWSLADSAVGGPDGGFDTILDGVDLADRPNIITLSRQYTNLDYTKEHCFVIEARYTEFNPTRGTRSVSKCIGPQTVETKPTLAELRSSVRAIFDNGCITCHGPGGDVQRKADLSVAITEIEKDASLIKAQKPDDSILYLEVSIGGMSSFLSLEEAKTIKEWILALTPEGGDTTAPTIMSYTPNGTVYSAGKTSVDFFVSTDENASCSYSSSILNLDYLKMTPFVTTGGMNHSHLQGNLKAGNYSYFVKCSDGKNISAHKEINFIIKDVTPTPGPSLEQLRASAREVFNRSCIRCHGDKAQYQSQIDLSLDLKVLEKNDRFIKLQDPENSYLYKKISGLESMAKYIQTAADRKIIYDWISLVDGKEIIVLNCAEGQEALDNVCITKGKVLRSHGYRMVTPEELFNDINSVFYVNLSNKDKNSGQAIVPEPKTLHGFDNQFGLVSANSVYVNAIEEVANLLGSALNAKSDFEPKNVSCMNDTVVNCGMAIANVYIPKLFRRPLTAQELEVYKTFFQTAKGSKKEVYINFFKALVQSPSFIFREEHGKLNNQDPLHQLDSYEVASRMSFFLTGASPDKDLAAKAKDGSIMQKSVREAEARRIMLSSSAQSHLAEKFMESIGIKKLVHEESLSTAMITETRWIIREVFFDDNKKWTDVFSTNYTYVNKALSDLYDYNADFSGGTWVKVDLANQPRAGILTHASYLSAFFDGKDVEQTKDIRRGINFYEKILCKNMPLPPPDVDIDLDPAKDLNGCNIDNRKNSTSNPTGTCFQCHQHFDPIGMGFEKFNNRGEYREVQKNDAKCSTVEDFYLTGGQKFSDVSSYTKAISENPQVGRCLAIKMKSYAYGSEGSNKYLKEIFLEMDRFKSSMNFKDLIVDIVTHDQFIKRESRNEN